MLSSKTFSSRSVSWLIPAMLCVALAVSSCGGGGGAGTTNVAPKVDDQAPVQSSLEVPPLPYGNPPGASMAATTMAGKLAPGINFGNIFEAPRDNDWGLPFSSATTLSTVAWNMGFKSVRLPVRWSNHAGITEPYSIDAAFMARVKSTVQTLINQGFVVVMDMHHYRDLDGDARDANELAAPAADHPTRMVLMWKQIAEEFKSFPNDKLVFEVYNEPHGRLQVGQGSLNDPWNALLARAMGQIRATNPNRIVVVGPTLYNNAYNLQYLQLPNDANMIVTVHQYEPFNFTHQGATFLKPPIPPAGQTCCSPAQQSQITAILNTAKTWSTQKNYPIYVGEFGAYSNNDFSVSMTTQRVNFNNYMRSEMTRLNFSWSYWELASGFGVYNLSTQTERTTLLKSLIP